MGEIGGLSKSSWPHNKKNSGVICNDILDKECLKKEKPVFTIFQKSFFQPVPPYIVTSSSAAKLNVDQSSTW
jgi:hypothetical protein